MSPITIDQIIAEKIGSLYAGEWPIGNFIVVVIALLLSVLLCGAIGMERERKGRSAGLRTHLLVGVGSCIIMIISIYGFPQIFGEKRDVARLAAQVIAGVGFLGAGAIIHKNSGIRGLTTAATIWIVMAIGLACGSMNFILAIMATAIILIVLTAFKKFESKINRKAPLMVARVKPGVPFMAKLLEVAKNFDCHVEDLQIESLDGGDLEYTFLAVTGNNKTEIAEFIAKVEVIEGVDYIGVLNSHKR